MATDYYELLGVGRNATEDEIKRAYRVLARELHPDTSVGGTGAEERFKAVSQAYETLRDPERRRRYDMFGPERVAAAGAGPSDVFGGGLGDLFDAFFGGAQGPFAGTRPTRQGPLRGPDAEVVLELSFEEAVFGADKEVSPRLAVTCATCSGHGARPGTTPTTCTACGGAGEVRRARQTILGQMVTASPCTRCRGLGEVVSSPCPDCRGEGRVTEARNYTVEVPAGVDHGSTLRLTGRGPAGPRGGPAGDLYVHLSVKGNDRFRRAGYDLVHTMHLPVTQAALGIHLDFETLDGSEGLLVPPGTQTGRTFRLRGRGVPHVESRGRGDLLVEVVVDAPTGLSAAQEELMRQLATERGEEVAPPEGNLLSKIRSAFSSGGGSER